MSTLAFFFFFMDFICALLLHSLSFHLAPWPLTCCLIALVVVSIVASLFQSLLPLLHHYFGRWFITLFIALFTPLLLHYLIHCITVLLARPTFMPRCLHAFLSWRLVVYLRYVLTPSPPFVFSLPCYFVPRCFTTLCLMC